MLENDSPKSDNTAKKLEELEKQNKEYLEGWKKERAGFLNYQKEEMERIGELVKYANVELILKILPILDNCLIAEKNISEELKKDKNIQGLLQVLQQLRDFLKSQGVEEIKAVGEKFDPNFHESIGEVSGGKTPAESAPGIIVEEIQKGYTLEGKVIRPVKVRVTK